MPPFNKILLVLDTRYDQPALRQHAVQLAKRTGASITLAETVPELPMRLQSVLPSAKDLAESLAIEKQKNLDAIAADLRKEGLNASTVVLYGKASLAIIRQVLQHQYDLVMKSTKGQYSRRPGKLGATATRLLRKCPCAVWLTKPTADPQITSILGCVDVNSSSPADEELNTAIVKTVHALCDLFEARAAFVYAWSIWHENLLRDQLTDEEFTRVVQQCESASRERLEQLVGQSPESAVEQITVLLKGDPEKVIPDYAKQNGIDLTVMGTVARSGLSGMLIGNTAELVLQELDSSILALKPSSYRSPVRVDD